MLGINHEVYSRFSRYVHPTIGSHKYEDDEDYQKIIQHISHISLLAMHILDRCYNILGFTDPHGLKTIMGENYEKSISSSLIQEFRRVFRVGDIVFIHSNDLAEIVECKVGKFDYRVYKVKFLSTPPLPQYPEDWIEGRRITLLFHEDGIKPFLEKSLTMNFPKAVKDILGEMTSKEENHKAMVDSLKKALTEMQNKGILIKMLMASNIVHPIQKSSNSSKEDLARSSGQNSPPEKKDISA